MVIKNTHSHWYYYTENYTNKYTWYHIMNINAPVINMTVYYYKNQGKVIES